MKHLSFPQSATPILIKPTGKHNQQPLTPNLLLTVRREKASRTGEGFVSEIDELVAVSLYTWVTQGCKHLIVLPNTKT